MSPSWDVSDELADAEPADVGELLTTAPVAVDELLRLSGNQRLADLVARLRNQTLRYGMRHASHDLLIATATDHRKIVNAIVSSDRDEAQRVMEAHLAANRGVLAAGAEHDAPASPAVLTKPLKHKAAV